ncbi:MAG: hypothetical protein ACR5KW_01800 [Wolbachia sp.]
MHLHAIKNKLSLTNEIDILKYLEVGFISIDNPLLLFLAGNINDRKVICSALFVEIDGSKLILMEIKALIARTNTKNPRKASIR